MTDTSLSAECLSHAQHLLAHRSVQQALSKFEEAEKLGADADACAAGRWECAMLLGCYKAAWQCSDEIDARAQAAGRLDSQRLWDGAPLTGKHVMLRCLHGFGDAIQFIRYAPYILEQAASLCVEAHPEITSLLRACTRVEQVITWEPPPKEQSAWDAQIEIMEVARIFRATPETVPVTFPYLDSTLLPCSPQTADLVFKMKRRRVQNRLQLGISWCSSNWNPLRSVPLQTLTNNLPPFGRCDVYSLQQGGACELAISTPSVENIESNFADLAVRIAQLDVVLTIDGVLAHLAGALGKPVLLLLPYAADWRWGLDTKTPWYPHTQLFRQQTPGDWSHPVEQALAVLRHLTST